MRRFVPLTSFVFTCLLLAGCGGAAAPASSAPPAAPSQAAPASSVAAAKPSAATSAAASAKPAASAGAASKPAGSAEASAPASIAPAKPGQVIAAYSEIVGANTALWGAKEGGFFEKNGLNVDVRYIESSLVVPALLSGQVQYGSVGGSETLAAAVQGGDMKILATTTPVYPYKFEVAKDIQNANDLKGKKIGISRIGSSSDIATRAGLKKLGLDPDKDVSLVQTGSLAARTAAIKSGAIQAAMANPPDTLTLEDLGFHPLIDLAAEKLPASNNGITIQGAYLAAHKAEVQKYVDSVVQAIAREKKDRAFSEQVMGQYLKIDDKRLLDAAYDYWIGTTTPSLPFPKVEQFTDSVAILADKNPAAKDFNVGNLLDPSFVQSAADRGLDKS
ncbi:MAG TPA: ABC transporter substrate-binding protein [Chloroflexota bacterium]|nr:ABC transporter substrate-binding protein [Chloroflexota bacterium]